MAKTQEELNELKIEYEALTTKLQELTEDELNMFTGGGFIIRKKNKCPYFGTSNCNYTENNKTSCPHHNEYICVIVETTN